MSKSIDLLAYTWKTHTLLNSMSISAAGLAVNTDQNGATSLVNLTDAAPVLSVSRVVPLEEVLATPEEILEGVLR